MDRVVVLFDIDGTLIRVGDPDHLDAFNEALALVIHTEACLDGIRLGGMVDRDLALLAAERVGMARESVRHLIDDVMLEMGQRYRQRVGIDHRRDWLLPGAAELLAALDQAGAACGVLTGNARDVARHKLQAAGIDHLVTFGGYGDGSEVRSELVAQALADLAAVGIDPTGRTDVVIVGDTPRDIAAARDAGVRVVAVATGGYTASELKDADAVFDDLTDLGPVLQAIRAG